MLYGSWCEYYGYYTPFSKGHLKYRLYYVMSTWIREYSLIRNQHKTSFILHVGGHRRWILNPDLTEYFECNKHQPVANIYWNKFLLCLLRWPFPIGIYFFHNVDIILSSIFMFDCRVSHISDHFHLSLLVYNLRKMNWLDSNMSVCFMILSMCSVEDRTVLCDMDTA